MYAVIVTVEPPNKGHFGNDLNYIARKTSSIGRFQNIVGIILHLKSPISFVERYNIIIMCPYLGKSTIRGSTVYKHEGEFACTQSTICILYFFKTNLLLCVTLSGKGTLQFSSLYQSYYYTDNLCLTVRMCLDK